MNNCGSIIVAGLGNCKAHLKKIRGMIIDPRGTVYTAAELATTAKLKTNLSADAGIIAGTASIYLPLSGWTPSTDAPNVVTGNIGTKSVFDDSIPSATAFLDIGFADFKALWGMNNTQVDVWFVTKDNNIVMVPTTDGKFSGFRCEVYCPQDFPNFESPVEAHQMMMHFKDVAQFTDMVVMALNFKATEIEDLVPIGLDIVQTADYASSEATVKVTLRGSITGKAGLTDWDVVSSNVDTPAVSATDDGSGAYTLELQKSAVPEDLAAGDYIIVQGKVVAATYVTYITPPIKING